MLLIRLCLIGLLLAPGLHAQVPGTLEWEGISRQYLLYAPPPTGAPRPLILALHGFTQTATAMMNGSGWNNVADTAGFVVVYPNGVNNAWNTNTGLPGGSMADDVGFLQALMDTLIVQQEIDPRRIYATGFSNGGFMSYELACRLGHRIAAIAPVAGTMTANSFGACQPQRAMPILHIHGTADLIVNYNGGFGNRSVAEVLAFWNTANGSSGPPQITALPDLVAEGSTVERWDYPMGQDSARISLLRVIGGGHTWPGFTGAFGLGNANQDIRAEVEIWHFFRQFALPGEPVGLVLPDQPGWQVYPNPARDQVTISGPHYAHWRLMDAAGRVCAAGLKDQAPVLSGLPPGTYWLELRTAREAVLAILPIQRI